MSTNGLYSRAGNSDSFPVPSIRTNDIDLYYETAGDGPPLLLIAGFASDSQSWAPVLPLLSAGRQLIMPDNRSVGRTEPRDADTSIELMAADCMQLLDTLGVEQADILGHSMGGMIAAYIATRWPERLRRLVIAASQPTQSARTDSLLDTLIALHEAQVPEDLWFKTLFHWLMAPPFFDNPDTVAEAIQMARTYPYRQSVAEMRRQGDAIARFDFGNRSAQIKAPTLALLGARDLLLPHEDSMKELQSIENIRITIVPDVAHSMHWDDPSGFADRVLNFLEGE